MLAAAGAVIIVLTAAGFWLSYAHLAEVAGAHGLAASPIRQWAWPATLDAFVVIGELLMLHAGLRREPDAWAIALTATGSVGSIVLNVAGVSGTGDAPVPVLDYVVAAVPPTAALLAFGVLMRQIHRLVAAPAPVSDATVAEEPRSAGPVIVASHNNAAAADHSATPTPVALVAEPTTARPVQRPAVRAVPADEVAAGAKQVASPVNPIKKPTSRLPSASMDEVLDIGRTAALGPKGRVSRRNIEAAVRGKGFSISRIRAKEAQRLLQAELGGTSDATS
ncbi:DUF2637 domain-containing protein [Streptomyces erythrochromogenes]|uniref:DUF2637 domain-containing protein n=1 Tax=Streptomyces erythrochromogenes TaxID=285574 RepID=UPI002258D6F1|nr:DUF2637 domain-containing protein [Streptomyces erythrochromogenes]MCX5585538.1 DUF2637 domain-containing protein [Streptomyces erythrochromogenes]